MNRSRSPQNHQSIERTSKASSSSSYDKVAKLQSRREYALHKPHTAEGLLRVKEDQLANPESANALSSLQCNHFVMAEIDVHERYSLEVS